MHTMVVNQRVKSYETHSAENSAFPSQELSNAYGIQIMVQLVHLQQAVQNTQIKIADFIIIIAEVHPPNPWHFCMQFALGGL